MGLNIKVDANVSSVSKSINELKSDLGSLRDTLVKATDVGTITKLNKAIQETESQIKKIKTATSSDFFGPMTQSANKAGGVLTDLTRIVSDAPYGFIAIQNNLQPALDTFTRLISVTGSVKGAFKELGGALVSGAGIGFAFSIVSSVVTSLIQKYGSLSKAIDALMGVYTEFDRELEKQNAKAGEEIARVRVLNAVIDDNTRKQTDRSKAASELSGILKDLNIEMSKEKILNGEVAEATRLATAAIVERARARAIESRIADLSGKQIDRDLQRGKTVKELNATEKEYQRLLANRTAGRNKDEIEAAGIDQFQANAKVQRLSKSIDDLDKESKKAADDIADLLAMIKADDLTIDSKGGADQKSVDLLKQRIAALKELQGLTGLDGKQQVQLAQLEIELAKRDAGKLGFTKEELQQKIQGILEKAFPNETFVFDTVITTRVNELKASTVKDGPELTKDLLNDIAKATGNETIELDLSKMVLVLKGTPKVDTKFDNELEAAITSSFVAIGDKIGQSLITGDFAESLAAAGDAVFDVIGSFLQEVGAQIIQMAVAMLALKSAIQYSFSNPALAIAAGIGLVALGAAFKALDFTGPKLFDGGITTGPNIFQAGESGREAIIPLTKLPFLMNSAATGGAGSTVVSLGIRDRELIAFLNRGQKYANRMF